MSGEYRPNVQPESPYEFVKRVSKSPQELGLTLFLRGTIYCPDIWELGNGDYAVIGRDITEEAKRKLPSDAAVSPGERVVYVPRRLLASAKPNIPDE